MIMSFPSGLWSWREGGAGTPVSPSRSPLVTSLSFTRSCHHLPVPPQAGAQTNLYVWAFEGHFTSPACHLSSPLQSVQQCGFQDVHRIVQPSLTDVLQQFYYPPSETYVPPAAPVSSNCFLSLDLQNMGGLCKWNHVLYDLLSSVSSPWCVLLFILEMNCVRYEDSFV